MNHAGAPREGVSEGLKWGAVGDGDAERLCVAFMGYGGWLEPFEYGLFTRLAQQLAARIVIVESPGLGAAGTRLSPGERAALLGGSFVPVGRRMLRSALAGLRAVGTDPDQGIHILGYSMGASVAAAATSVATNDLTIRTLTLVEPIAIKAWVPWRLLKASSDELRERDESTRLSHRLAGAQARCDSIPGVPRPARSHLDQALLPAALCWPTIPAYLASIGRTRPDLRVLIINGDTSRMSPRASVHRMLRSAEATGMSISARTIRGGHLFWHDVPLLHEAGRQVEAHWDP